MDTNQPDQRENDDKHTYLVCVLWGDQTTESVERECCDCQAKVAAGAANIPVLPDDARFMCAPCYFARLRQDTQKHQPKGVLLSGTHINFHVYKRHQNN